MIKVLFIAGSGRSGSTVLQNVLGQIDGFAAVGELRYVWGRGALANQLCGCNRRFSDCPFWTDVMGHAFGGLDRLQAEQMRDFTSSFRIRSLPRMWLPRRRQQELARLGSYLERLGKLYTAIQQVSGCRVIVDSSKNPSYGYLLREVADVEPFFLHLIRDAPPVAHSWGKRKEFEPGVPMARKSPIGSALQWTARNLTAELFLPNDPARRMPLHYEDLMVSPLDRLVPVMDWLGEPAADLPFASQHEALITRTSHSVFGNSVRFLTGPVTLRTDQRWRAEMAPRDQRAVAAITWPLRRRYGYLGSPPTPDPVPGGLAA